MTDNSSDATGADEADGKVPTIEKVFGPGEWLVIDEPGARMGARKVIEDGIAVVASLPGMSREDITFTTSRFLKVHALFLGNAEIGALRRSLFYSVANLPVEDVVTLLNRILQGSRELIESVNPRSDPQD